MLICLFTWLLASETPAFFLVDGNLRRGEVRRRRKSKEKKKKKKKGKKEKEKKTSRRTSPTYISPV